MVHSEIVGYHKILEVLNYLNKRNYGLLAYVTATAGVKYWKYNFGSNDPSYFIHCKKNERPFFRVLQPTEYARVINNSLL